MDPDRPLYRVTVNTGGARVGDHVYIDLLDPDTARAYIEKKIIVLVEQEEPAASSQEAPGDGAAAEAEEEATGRAEAPETPPDHDRE